VKTRRWRSGTVYLVCVLACVLATAAAVSACGSGSDPGPLAADVAQRSFATCVPAPDAPGQIKAWDTRIGFSTASFVNVSRSRLVVESVSLIDAHNLILHGALVYEQVHSQHPMIQQDAWATIGDSVPPSDRTGIQQVPGAVIAAGFPTNSFRPRFSLNIYEIVPDVSLAKPGGGWAIGEVVRYRSGGQTYTVTAYTGYGIGVSPEVSKNYCTAQLNAMTAAFKTSG
jgi:hypothetical protein